MFAKCGTKCCVCGRKFCLAGEGDDDYTPASVETVLRRLEMKKYADHREQMIEYVKAHGYDWDVEAEEC